MNYRFWIFDLGLANAADGDIGDLGFENAEASGTDAATSGEEYCELGDLAGFFEAETRAAGMELGRVAVTEVAEEV